MNISTPFNDYLALTAYGLLPAHFCVTRDASNSCFDHVILKTKLNRITIIPKSTLIYHKSVILSIKKEQSCKYTYTTQNKIFKDGLRKDIKDMDFSPIYRTDDCNFALIYFIDVLKIAVNKNTEMVLLPRRIQILKPWIFALYAKQSYLCFA